MKRVVHLIPRDGIGGVESAARSMLGEDLKGCEFHLFFLAGSSSVKECEQVVLTPFRSVNNPLAHIYSIKKILSMQPDLLVCSLWRSIPVGILVKLFRPRVRLVFFLHSAMLTHWLDSWFSWLMLKFCDAVWGDSATTITARLGTKMKISYRVISFVTARCTVQSRKDALAPRFVFWGRLHHHKGLDRSLNFIRLLIDRGYPAVYEIWGPDDGEKEGLLKRITDLGLQKAVRFRGIARQDELDRIAEQNSFFLMFSRCEGMAMSVVEAMQRGLVPIVTPVGEIAVYCQDGKNVVVVKDPGSLAAPVDEVVSLLSDEAAYRVLQKAAGQYWAGHILYREDFCQAAVELLQS